MDHTALYEEDVFAWSQQQAAVLRRLAAGGAALPNELDVEHVAEEIEDVGNSELNHVRSNLEEMLIHLIKAASSPGTDPVRGWLIEIGQMQRKASRHFTSAMRRRLDLQAIWVRARRGAAAELALYGESPAELPDPCPHSLDELVDEAATVEALVARLASPPPAP